MSYTYMDTAELSTRIQSNDDSILVVDVRGDDFIDGHIPNAIQVSSELWDDVRVIDNLLASYPTKSTIVVHCMMSQIRGPKCARKLSDRLSALTSSPETETDKPEIKVLRGGYDAWYNMYSNTSDMIAYGE
mmetsp:Transcript_29091/g.29435  ORF Transcript_29091/g.29435 Transcript_29091/m.29435 type:complete len:131 (+) Transcript_29091:194-586(+)|eukprot:CAMPEP_0182419362 /NCGR_PEP_ID=MMETSP1167-20130531/3809_1 /TAXON_ID=2988 /ORGANISM="Mallomonas Sp, Strain CCMP3275" /LENGTH=130 /DNA_ID=CAMNT_0024594225 /DNA_START=161 /DNA_END=553 /DNA_ORIENTATION=+